MTNIAKKKNGNWKIISIATNDLNHMGDDDVIGVSVINSSLNVEAYQSKLVRSIWG